MSEPKSARGAVEGLVRALRCRNDCGCKSCRDNARRALADYEARRPLREDAFAVEMVNDELVAFSTLDTEARERVIPHLLDAFDHLLSGTGPATAKRKCETCGGAKRVEVFSMGALVNSPCPTCAPPKTEGAWDTQESEAPSKI